MTFTRFTPKRPIKSFQDLEVYQRLLAMSVAVAKRVKSEKVGSLALELPVKIARAHSWRFSDKTRAVEILEDIMLGCNLLIVYLEQYRDIENVPVPKLKTAVAEPGTPPSTTDNAGTGTAAIEHEFFEEQILTLLSCRWKVMHLARSWEKFGQTAQ